MAIPLTEQQISQAKSTHSTLLARDAMSEEMSKLYRKNTLTPQEMNRKVALQSAQRSYQEPSESEMKNHAHVVSTAQGRAALGIKGKWPSSQTPYNMVSDTDNDNG